MVVTDSTRFPTICTNVITHNAISFITNCDKCYYKLRMCYWKLRQVLLQITTSVHAECDYCSKVREFYNKVRQVLQRATIITKCDKTNTSYTSFKWDHSFCLEISLGHFSIDMFHSVLEHEHTFICKPDRLKEIYRNNTRNIRSGYVLSLSWRKD